MSDTLQLAIDLVRRASVTPNDAGCQQVMISRLEALDFIAEPMRFGDVDNFWARRGSSGPVLCFAGHTDVVPTGPPDAWQHDPFSATIADGYLYGRGAADMKGSLAAMVTATERFVANHPDHQGSIAYLITSDEEGPAVDGTIKVVDALEARDEKLDWALVGEPSSEERLGDVVKNGRRGSLGGRLVVRGVQGHVAYPHRAKNPVHQALPVLALLAKEQWDRGNEYFPPTTFQISNINAGTGATNVIPGTLEVTFNFRYSTETDQEKLMAQVATILDEYGLDYELHWTHSGRPFLTRHGELIEAAKAAIAAETGFETRLSTAGGTSDGRFIAPTGAQVLELGPLNSSIHQINERVDVGDLDMLSRIYESVLVRLLA